MRYHWPGVSVRMRWSSISILYGREERGECGWLYKGEWPIRSREMGPIWSIRPYFLLDLTETIFSISFGSSGSSPDLGSWAHRTLGATPNSCVVGSSAT